LKFVAVGGFHFPGIRVFITFHGQFSLLNGFSAINVLQGTIIGKPLDATYGIEHENVLFFKPFDLFSWLNCG
jgi:hypothetical protein